MPVSYTHLDVYKRQPIPPIMPLATYEEAVGYERIKVGYKQALRGQRKYTREAVKYDLFREKNNVDLWRELKSSKYTPGPYHFTVITEPKRRDLSIPKPVSYTHLDVYKRQVRPADHTDDEQLVGIFVRRRLLWRELRRNPAANDLVF